MTLSEPVPGLGCPIRMYSLCSLWPGPVDACGTARPTIRIEKTSTLSIIQDLWNLPSTFPFDVGYFPVLR